MLVEEVKRQIEKLKETRNFSKFILSGKLYDWEYPRKADHLPPLSKEGSEAMTELFKLQNEVIPHYSKLLLSLAMQVESLQALNFSLMANDQGNVGKAYDDVQRQVLGLPPKVKTKVNIYEFERGWGSKLDETKEFDTYEEAEQFCTTYNAKNNKDVVPDWYMKAEIVRR